MDTNSACPVFVRQMESCRRSNVALFAGLFTIDLIYQLLFRSHLDPILPFDPFGILIIGFLIVEHAWQRDSMEPRQLTLNGAGLSAELRESFSRTLWIDLKRIDTYNWRGVTQKLTLTTRWGLVYRLADYADLGEMKKAILHYARPDIVVKEHVTIPSPASTLIVWFAEWVLVRCMFDLHLLE